MSMVCGLDLHRQQITFDVLETESGEVWRGRVWQPDRERFRRWLCRDVARRAGGQPVAMVVEGCTGWRYVVEEIVAAGFEAHLAEPADTQAARGRKRHAKTDRSDARMLRELLQSGELPESWVPPTDVLEWRERVRLYKSLVDQRRVWIQRIHAELFQHGVAVPEGAIRSTATRDRLLSDEVDLTPAGRQRVRVGYSMLEATDVEAQLLKRGSAALRSSPAGVSGAGRSHVRHRWVDRRGGVVRARRLSSLLSVRAGGPSQRPGRLRRLLRSSSRPWPSHPAGAADVEVGVVRSGDERVASPQPRPRLLQRGEGSSRRQAGRHLRRPPVRPTLLPRAAQPRSRHRLRHAGLIAIVGDDGQGRPHQHHGSPPRSAPATGVPASHRAGRPSNTDATALPVHGGHPITIVVADDITFVEHLGNAGRPHAAVNRPISSVHQEGLDNRGSHRKRRVEVTARARRVAE